MVIRFGFPVNHFVDMSIRQKGISHVNFDLFPWVTICQVFHHCCSFLFLVMPVPVTRVQLANWNI